MRNSQFFCRVIFAHRFCVYSSPLCHFYIRYNVLPTEYGKLKLRLLTEHAYFAHLLLSQHSQNQYLICPDSLSWQQKRGHRYWWPLKCVERVICSSFIFPRFRVFFLDVREQYQIARLSFAFSLEPFKLDLAVQGGFKVRDSGMVVAQRQGILVIRAAGDTQDTIQPFAGAHDQTRWITPSANCPAARRQKYCFWKWALAMPMCWFWMNQPETFHPYRDRS